MPPTVCSLQGCSAATHPPMTVMKAGRIWHCVLCWRSGVSGILTGWTGSSGNPALCGTSGTGGSPAPLTALSPCKKPLTNVRRSIRRSSQKILRSLSNTTRRSQRHTPLTIPATPSAWRICTKMLSATTTPINDGCCTTAASGFMTRWVIYIT